MSDESKRDCPYCKETVKSTAIKCKHCGSALQPVTNNSDTECPYCKESVKAGAVICKHCKSAIGSPMAAGAAPAAPCGCSASNVGSAANEFMSLARQQQQQPTVPIKIECGYFGPFFGRWCCLVVNGRTVVCTNQFQENNSGFEF